MNFPKLIACDPLVGLPRVPLENGVQPDLSDLRTEMVRLHIAGALVRHRLCVDNGPYTFNRVLVEELQGQTGLRPVFMLTPDGETPEFAVANSVRDALRANAAAAWIHTKDQFYSPSTWCCGELYAALQATRLPLLIEYDQVSGEQLHDIASNFPELRLILLRIPRIGRNRNLYPLLKQHPNLFGCFDPPFSVFQGFRNLCDTFGPDRWVFGMGYPAAESGAAITGLMYAGLNDSELEAVGHRNLERLLAEVKHDAL